MNELKDIVTTYKTSLILKQYGFDFQLHTGFWGVCAELDGVEMWCDEKSSNAIDCGYMHDMAWNLSENRCKAYTAYDLFCWLVQSKKYSKVYEEAIKSKQAVCQQEFFQFHVSQFLTELDDVESMAKFVLEELVTRRKHGV